MNFIKFFVCLSAFFSLNANVWAKNYYFSSSSGNDSYSSTQAQNSSTPWSSISKLNSFFSSLVPGDNVYFKRGDTFYGTITVNKSGSGGIPITINAYGTGAKPLITGFTKISGWTNEGGGIYSKVITSANLTNMVTIDGVQYGMGRYPDANWLTYESFVNNVSITDNTIGSSTNWTGAEVVIRKNNWTIDRCSITSHIGNTLAFNNKGTTSSPTANFGYFIQNDVRTLTTFGEWYHNIRTGKFYMYFGATAPTTKIVKVATVNNIVINNGFNYITLDNINFQGSIDNVLNYIGTCDNAVVQNCDVRYAGKTGLYFYLGGAQLINGNTVQNCNRTGISVDGTATISNNFVRDIDIITGQQLGTSGVSSGLYIVGNNTVAKYNTIKKTGYNGITLKSIGPSTTQYNFIDSVCTGYNDGGGIYTAGPNSSVRLIDHNIVTNVIGVIGSISGTTSRTSLCGGIYLDEYASNVTISNNTVADCPSSVGIKLHRSNSNVLSGNTVFNNDQGFLFQKASSATYINNKFNNNIAFAKLATQYPITISSAENGAISITADNNYYARPIDDNLTIRYYQPSYVDYIIRSLGDWQIFSRVDLRSKKSPKKITNTSELRFEYNATSSAVSRNFSGLRYMDVTGTNYDNSISIPAWSSKVLIANGTASVGNKLPLANAGTDKTITLPTNNAILSGIGTDIDGTISSYEWLQIQGPSSSNISSPNSASTTINNLIEGVYQYQLTVKDNNGAIDRDTILVSVNILAGLPGNLLPAVNPTNIENGLNYKYYEGTWTALPDFTMLTSVKSGTVSSFDISVANNAYNYGLNFTGYINIPSDGQYTFYTTSDDGSNLYIDNILTVTNDLVHGAIEKSGTIGLKAGKHAIRGLFFQQLSGKTFLVSYSGSGIAKQIIPASVLYRTNLLPAVNPTNTVNGLNYKYYEGTWTALPDFTMLTSVKAGTVSSFDISVANNAYNYGLNFTGYINIPSDGQYTFYTTSDDGSNLYIDNILTVSNDLVHGAIEKSGTIGLKAGKHAIKGVFFQQFLGKTFIVSYAGSGISKQTIPPSALYRVNGSTSKVANGTDTISTPANNIRTAENPISSVTSLKISTYPNPFINEFRLKLIGGSKEKIAIYVTSADGKAVFSINGTTNRTYILGANFTSGLYIIQVIQGTKIETMKVIKM